MYVVVDEAKKKKEEKETMEEEKEEKEQEEKRTAEEKEAEQSEKQKQKDKNDALLKSYQSHLYRGKCLFCGRCYKNSRLYIHLIIIYLSNESAKTTGLNGLFAGLSDIEFQQFPDYLILYDKIQMLLNPKGAQ